MDGIEPLGDCLVALLMRDVCFSNCIHGVPSMTYMQLVQLYMERSSALQWFWTIYVIVIGGLLAFSSLRARRDFATMLLLTGLQWLLCLQEPRCDRRATAERTAVLESPLPTFLLAQTRPN